MASKFDGWLLQGVGGYLPPLRQGTDTRAGPRCLARVCRALELRWSELVLQLATAAPCPELVECCVAPRANLRGVWAAKQKGYTQSDMLVVPPPLK